MQAPVFDPKANLVRNLMLLKGLEEVLSGWPGPAPLLLKGGALIACGCSDIRTRLMQDLDLLVPKGRLRGFADYLRGLGYKKAPGGFGDFSKQGVNLDLHEDLWYLNGQESGELWQKTRTAKLGAGGVLIPHPEDHLIFVLAHAAIHHGTWEPKWRDDVENLVKHHSADISLARVQSRLQNYGIDAPIHHFLTNCGLDRILEEMNAGQTPKNPGRLLKSPDSLNKGHRLRFRYLRNWRFRLSHALKTIFPSQEFLALRYDLNSPAQIFFYRLLRPLLLLRNFLSL